MGDDGASKATARHLQPTPPLWPAPGPFQHLSATHTESPGETVVADATKEAPLQTLLYSRPRNARTHGRTMRRAASLASSFTEFTLPSLLPLIHSAEVQLLLMRVQQSGCQACASLNASPRIGCVIRRYAPRGHFASFASILHASLCCFGGL